MIRIGVACDHGGFELKQQVMTELKSEGYPTQDFGAYRLASNDDYPDYVLPLAEAVARGEVDRGIAICGSGVGACIIANKVPGIRASLINETFSARQGVEDDDMNVICLGGRVIGIRAAWELIEQFLHARFSGAERHRRRLAKIAAFAESGRSSSTAGENALRILNDMLEKQIRLRTSALEMVRDIAFMANLSQNVDEALEYGLQRIAMHSDWNFGHAFLPSEHDPDVLLPACVWYADESNERFRAFRELTLKSVFRRGEPIPGQVYGQGKPDWTTDIHSELGVRRVKLAEDLGIATTVAFPLLVEQAVVGVVELFSETPIEPDSEMLESMASIGAQLGRVIERKQFENRLLTIADEEHRRIGQELCDDVGQELTGLALKSETLAEMLGDDSPASALAREILVSLDRTREKAQSLSLGLVPVEVDAPSLEAALEGLALRMGEEKMVSCTVRSRDDYRVADSRTATQLYRIAQEAVSDALASDETTEVEILLDNDKVATTLEICDDRSGLSPETERRAGVGMRIMQYRADLIGGTLNVVSHPKGGTRITCRVPRELKHAQE